MNKLKFNINQFNWMFEMEHAQTFRVPRRNILLRLTQWKRFDYFPSLSWTHTLSIKKMKFKINHLIGGYRIGHTQLLCVHRRNILLRLAQLKHFEFPCLSCKHTFNMNKLKFIILTNLIGP